MKRGCSYFRFVIDEKSDNQLLEFSIEATRMLLRYLGSAPDLPTGQFLGSVQWAVQLPCPALPTDFDGQVSFTPFPDKRPLELNRLTFRLFFTRGFSSSLLSSSDCKFVFSFSSSSEFSSDSSLRPFAGTLVFPFWGLGLENLLGLYSFVRYWTALSNWHDDW